MTWQVIKEWLDPFLWGFIIGFCWMPIWSLAKKIWAEAKIASATWRNPSGKSD